MPDRRRLSDADLRRLLRGVQKPGRYTGGEWNAVPAEAPGAAAPVRVALVFPDVYEIGMSYLGQKILYDLLNRRPGTRAERAFAPWPDFERALRATGTPLFSLEGRRPLRDFDVLGFSLLYELNLSNVLTVLDLAGIPLSSGERGEGDPLILAGGPAAFNPEPTAAIFDAVLVGDGEEAVPEVVDRWAALRRGGTPRAEAVAALAAIEGVYVPSLYDAVPGEGTALLHPRPRGNAPAVVRKRVAPAFETLPFPRDLVVPNLRAIFDRVAVEASRGCPRGCRFCQAASIYFPHRAKDPSVVAASVLGGLDATGYEDCSLSALSVGDFPGLEETVRALMDRLEPRKVGLSLSSLRPGALSDGLVDEIVRVRKTGFTLVPEAGTERLRRVINKGLTRDEMMRALESAFSRGWRLVKLYFMIGLPTERDEDVDGIVELVRESVALGRRVLGSPPRLNVSLSSFIPKPHTAFQWLGMEEAASLEEKQRRVRAELRRERSVEVKTHDVQVSLLEAVFSRGDRALGPALRSAWEAGARFDSWRDAFRFDRWEEAFAKTGVDWRRYLAPIPREAVLPWDHIDTGLRKAHLLSELERALAEERTPPCDERDCGSCRGCRFPGRRPRPAAGPVEIALPAPEPLGVPADGPTRYRARFAKTGLARYMSHIDLIHVLQRGFRRAGVDVLSSQGFHPKPLVSFGPALALGMEGRSEVLEFRSGRRFGEAEFLGRVNAALPAGLAFTKLEALEAGEKPLSTSIRALAYSLDLADEDVAAAALRARGPEAGGADVAGAVERALRDFGPRLDAEGVRASIDRERRRLALRIAADRPRPPRVQDVVRELLGLEGVVDVLTREAVLLEGDDV